jgi:anti-anti-sigma factor
MNYEYTLEYTAGAPAAILQGALGIYTTLAIRDRLLELLAGQDELAIDLAGVTDIDCAGLQLLLLAKRHPDKSVRFIGHSEPVRRLVEFANLAAALDLAVDEPPAAAVTPEQA